MESLDEKKPCYAPAYVVGIYPRLTQRARKMGYALALHGSLQRDLDIVAVSWKKKAASAEKLVKSLAGIFNLEPNHPIGEPTKKPHGRLSWSLPLWWGAYIDLSVMPLQEGGE